MLDADSDVPNVLVIGSNRSGAKCEKKQHTVGVRSDKQDVAVQLCSAFKETLTCCFFFCCVGVFLQCEMGGVWLMESGFHSVSVDYRRQRC